MSILKTIKLCEWHIQLTEFSFNNLAPNQVRKIISRKILIEQHSLLNNLLNAETNI